MDNPIKAISNKNVLLITLAVFSIALIPRIYHQSSLSGDQVRTILAPDEQAYEMLVNNRDITPDMSPSYFLNPLYPTVLSGLKVIFGNQLTPARWFNAILGSLSCLFIFLLSRKYVSKLSALIITVILAFYGPLIFLEGKLLATTIAVFLVSFSLYIYQLSREKYHIVWGMIAGLLMGLAVWARPNIILVWPFFWFDSLIRVKKTRNLVICFQTAFILTFGIMALKNS
ncbi:MAG: glycosyltransferase family 39 protein, partial [candidate division Zixibacteria bacterium]|nr:glycosyltransferase family 39 protein [candidate division Zixibacteria bacterium]